MDTSPDQSAVEIQYAAVYTEGILPSIQCTCSIYCQISISYTAVFRVNLQYILQTSWSVHSVYTATILPYTASLLHFGQGVYQVLSLSPKNGKWWSIYGNFIHDVSIYDMRGPSIGYDTDIGWTRPLSEGIFVYGRCEVKTWISMPHF